MCLTSKPKQDDPVRLVGSSTENEQSTLCCIENAVCSSLAPRGQTGDAKSWRKPGQISSMVRAAPRSGLHFETSTANPAWASTIAAERPLGPEPMTHAIRPIANSCPTFASVLFSPVGAIAIWIICFCSQTSRLAFRGRCASILADARSFACALRLLRPS